MIDSHCHLDFDAFDGKRDSALKDCRDAGVHTVINIGTDVAASRRSVQLAEEHDMVYATVGVHPHDASTLDDAAFARIAELADHKKVVAVGEIGLDYYRDLSPRDVQQKAFRRQIELAVEKKLPIVIHTRESFADTLDIVREYAHRLSGGVFHCFPGTAKEMREITEMGFYISVGGVITFPKAKMAAVAMVTPPDRILLETDAPFLTPEPHRGKQNFPVYVQHVYRRLAALKQLPLPDLERIVDRNVQKLFGLVETFGG